MLLYYCGWYGNEKWEGLQFGLFKYAAYFIHSSSVTASWLWMRKPIPGTLGDRQEYTLNGTPIQCRAACTYIHT